MNILHLYRPRLPSSRAQSIQVLRTCHALATLGHKVTLLADRGRHTKQLWEQMGLRPHQNLQLNVAPIHHSGLAGLWFRHRVSRWWKGPPGVVLARDKRRLLQAIHSHGKQHHRVVMEVHELDSLQDNGQINPDWYALEAACLDAADALIANCGGTLSAWQEHHTFSIPSMVCHNASHVEVSGSQSETNGVLVLGSMRSTKGVDMVLEALNEIQVGFRWVGGTQEERQRWSSTTPLEPPVPHGSIHSLLAQARVLMLPLGNNAFSHRFTSPLKLWDYLATDRPIVAAKTQAVAEICAQAQSDVFLYEPDNIESIQHAIQQALRAPARTPYRRTWDTRATEISSFFQRAL